MENKTKTKYQTLETLRDGIEFVKSLNGEDLIKFRDALQIVQDNFGLTMREDYILTLIKSEADRRIKK